MAGSTKSSPSPQQGPVVISEERLPEGNCRYLLPQQELRGQRCGCVHFTLNRSIPGAACICGHQSCFHTTEPYVPELEHLRNKVKALEAAVENKFRSAEVQVEDKVKALEAQVDRVFEEKLTLVARVSSLEEIVEKSREEASQEIKGAYANLHRAWEQISELQRQARDTQSLFRLHGEQIQTLQDDMRRLDNRQKEMAELEIEIEERLDVLEAPEEPPSPQHPEMRTRRPSESDGDLAPQPTGGGTVAPVLRPLTIPPADSTNLWTVHISLLPDSSQPMPFEKDTNAYKRCLSRGLHQMVVIDGFDASSVMSCVSKAFNGILKDRPWMPLQAVLCNAQSLQGLPMLKRLDQSLVHGRYDAEFLRRYCAVCDANGKMDSLYIAMCFDTLSWYDLRRSTPYMPGLEACWGYDPPLDDGRRLPNDTSDNDEDAIDDRDRPSAGSIMPTIGQRMKRGASEISRSSSFGANSGPGGHSAAANVTSAANDGEGSRPKVARVHPHPNIVEARSIVEGRRRIETA